jgi:hypothetical protein
LIYFHRIFSFVVLSSLIFDAMPANARALPTVENIPYANNIPTRKMRFCWDKSGPAAQLLLDSFNRRADFARRLNCVETLPDA